MYFTLTLIKNFIKNDVLGIAAQTAFYLILSLPPLMVLIISISVSFNVELMEMSFIHLFLPANVFNVISFVMTSIKPSTQITVISGVSVVFSASGSIWALMKGIHKTHNNGSMSLSFKHRILTAVFTVIFLIALLLSLATLIFIGVWTALLDTLSGFEKNGLGIISRVFSAIVIYGYVHSLYAYTPEVGLKGKELFWGSLFSASCWMIVSMFFEKYVTYFTRYTTIYGGIGAFFILILWLFVISVIILTGSQINEALMEISET